MVYSPGATVLLLMTSGTSVLSARGDIRARSPHGRAGVEHLPVIGAAAPQVAAAFDRPAVCDLDPFAACVDRLVGAGWLLVFAADLRRRRSGGTRRPAALRQHQRAHSDQRRQLLQSVCVSFSSSSRIPHVSSRPEDDLTISPSLGRHDVASAAFAHPAAVVASIRHRRRSSPAAIASSRSLGRGGMGEVYRADDLTLDHPVALKFLAAESAQTASDLALFHNELRIARQVSHKNVCRLYDLGEADGRRFLTMEYVDGEDLASLLRRIGRIPQDKAIELARQLCAGLAAAHERGVLHRDLKPANVMIDGDGNVRITDFGTRGRRGRQRRAATSRARRSTWRRSSSRPAGVCQDRHLRARARPLRDLHRPPRLRREDADRPRAVAQERRGRRRPRRSCETSIRPSSGSSCAASSATPNVGRHRPWPSRPRCRVRIRWPKRSRREKRRRPSCSSRPAKPMRLRGRRRAVDGRAGDRRPDPVRAGAGARVARSPDPTRQAAGGAARSLGADPGVARLPEPHADVGVRLLAVVRVSELDRANGSLGDPLGEAGRRRHRRRWSSGIARIHETCCRCRCRSRVTRLDPPVRETGSHVLSLDERGRLDGAARRAAAPRTDRASGAAAVEAAVRRGRAGRVRVHHRRTALRADRFRRRAHGVGRQDRRLGRREGPRRSGGVPRASRVVRDRRPVGAAGSAGGHRRGPRSAF